MSSRIARASAAGLSPIPLPPRDLAPDLSDPTNILSGVGQPLANTPTAFSNARGDGKTVTHCPDTVTPP